MKEKINMLITKKFTCTLYETFLLDSRDQVFGRIFFFFLTLLIMSHSKLFYVFPLSITHQAHIKNRIRKRIILFYLKNCFQMKMFSKKKLKKILLVNWLNMRVFFVCLCEVGCENDAPTFQVRVFKNFI